MNLGNRLQIIERVSGVLLVPGGAPTIYTLERGQVAKVVRVRDESNIVEVETNGHHLLFSQEALAQHGVMVSMA